MWVPKRKLEAGEVVADLQDKFTQATKYSYIDARVQTYDLGNNIDMYDRRPEI